MKKMTRILSVALVAMMVMSLAAVAQAATPSVYIPGKLAKLVDAYVDDYAFPTLDITTTALKGNAWVKRITEDSVAQLQFFEKPDWAGVNLSSLDGGWTSLDVDESGYAELAIGELHRQPGMYSWTNSNVTYWDKDCKLRFRNDWTEGKWEGAKTFKKDELVPDEYFGWLFGNGGDYPYSAGKDYGNYNVTVNYHRNGAPYQVAVSLKGVDAFETGMEGAVTTITFELVNVQLDSYRYIVYTNADGDVIKHKAPYAKYIKNLTFNEDGEVETGYYHYDENEILAVGPLSSTDVWYVSSVSATYPEGNPIIAVEADYRNDAKNNLYGYTISYAVSENEVYEITYNTSNTPIFGLYSRNGSYVAVSGSGNNIGKWYKYNGMSSGKWNNGKQVKTVKKSIKTFSSPRVTVK